MSLDEAYQKAAQRFEWFKLMKEPLELPGEKKLARVDHVDGKAVFEWRGRYLDSPAIAKVEVDIAKYWRLALLTNLAAIASDDRRDFYLGQVSHHTVSHALAVERIFAWGLFMPGDYVLKAVKVYNTRRGQSIEYEAISRFGRGGSEKIESESFAHYFTLGIARRLAGRNDLVKVRGAPRYIRAAAWLGISAILATPEGEVPSEGLELLMKKRAIPKDIYYKSGIRGYFYDLDWRLRAVTPDDKTYVVMRLVDYDGHIAGKRLLVSAKELEQAEIKVNGTPLRMRDVLETAARAFYERGGWSGIFLVLGRTNEIPGLDSIPALKRFLPRRVCICEQPPR
ncbi:MAG: hypothetical protein JZD41_02865 [Thermoproteus sp.]|nr:hypothetical protein [Thermoproteus sp.]